MPAEPGFCDLASSSGSGTVAMGASARHRDREASDPGWPSNTIAAIHPDYKPKYNGDLRSRDAAYHQGTVWAWLIGPYTMRG